MAAQCNLNPHLVHCKPERQDIVLVSAEGETPFLAYLSSPLPALRICIQDGDFPANFCKQWCVAFISGLHRFVLIVKLSMLTVKVNPQPTAMCCAVSPEAPWHFLLLLLLLLLQSLLAAADQYE